MFTLKDIMDPVHAFLHGAIHIDRDIIIIFHVYGFLGRSLETPGDLFRRLRAAVYQAFPQLVKILGCDEDQDRIRISAINAAGFACNYTRRHSSCLRCG